MKDTLRTMYAFALTMAIMLCGFQWANADPIEISDWHDLNDVRDDLQAEYVLVNDLDEDTDGYSDYNDDGWEPIGDTDERFMGSFDGQEHTIYGLTIDAEATWAGLFGRTLNATINNLSIMDADVTSHDVGGIGVLAGELEASDVENVTVSGTLTAFGTDNTIFGGLAGRQSAGHVSNVASYVEITYEGRFIGGIYGQMTAQAELEKAVFKGNITTDNPHIDNRWIGGIVGQFGGGSMVTDAYAMADIKGTRIVGGIVGYHWRGGATVTNSYFVGAVEGDQETVDAHNEDVDEEDELDLSVGGVVGHKDPPQDPESEDDISGLVNTFWDTEVTGLDNIYGTGEYHEDADLTAEGKTTSEMTDQNTYAEWDFDNVWEIDDVRNSGYPYFQSEELALDTEEELISDRPSEVELKQNYPNPFNPSTNIEFTIPNTVEVQLDVYNVAGQRVATLVDEHMSAGTHTVTFDASDLPSGVYIYRLTAGDHVESNNMTFIK